MNCECVQKMEKLVQEKLTADAKFKRPIVRVRMQGVVLAVTKDLDLKAHTVNKMEIYLDGQKKIETMNMFHSFCPFCGTKINTETEGEPK